MYHASTLDQSWFRRTGPRSPSRLAATVKLTMAAGALTAGLMAMSGFSSSPPASHATLSAPFERKILVPPGEAPLELRFFSTAVKTDSKGQIITGPDSDPVKNIVGAEP